MALGNFNHAQPSPMPAGAELTEAERRESLIDTFGSWALEGMHPSPADIYYGKKYISGEMTPQEIIDGVLAEYSTNA